MSEDGLSLPPRTAEPRRRIAGPVGTGADGATRPLP
jgi:hypothetical protein